MNKRQKKKQFSVVQNKLSKLIKKKNLEVTARPKGGKRLSPDELIETEKFFRSVGIKFETAIELADS